MKKILWVAPNLNHYKLRFLNRLNKEPELEFVVLAGGQMSRLGHRTDTNPNSFELIELKTTKDKFNLDPKVYLTIWNLLLQKKFDILLIPAEKKHWLLIFYVFVLKFFLKFQMISYNHPTLRARKNSNFFSELFLTKFFFIFYDKIVFYTQQSRNWALKEKLLSPSKAYYANNSLDTETIWKNYSFQSIQRHPKLYFL